MTHTQQPAGSRRGRPPATDAATLQDAAFELFTLQGYEHASIGDITQLAGVSRNTFFNYFAMKSDVFWLQIDEALALLPASLAQTSPDTPVISAIGEAISDCVVGWDAGHVPWVLTQFDVMGAPAAVRESGMSRFVDAAALLSTFASERLGQSSRELLPSVIGATTTAGVTAAARSWAEAGPSRGHIRGYLLRALAPLADGFAMETEPARVKSKKWVDYSG